MGPWKDNEITIQLDFVQSIYTDADQLKFVEAVEKLSNCIIELDTHPKPCNKSFPKVL